MLIVSIPGKPIPCPRPRVGRKGVHYPASYTAQLDAIRVLTRSEMHKRRVKMFDGPVGVSAYFNRPHGLADIDNLTKTVLDGMEGVVYENDRQVKRLNAVITQDDDEEPETHIQVDSLNESWREY